jgi:hypothetical protein
MFSHHFSAISEVKVIALVVQKKTGHSSGRRMFKVNIQNIIENFMTSQIWHKKNPEVQSKEIRGEAMLS